MLNAVEGTAERRQHQRLAMRVPLEYRLLERTRGEAPELRNESETRDICLGGVSFDAVIDDPQAAGALQKGKKLLKLRLVLAERGSEIETGANVAWMYALKGLATRSKYGIGASFARLGRTEARELSDYLTTSWEERQREVFQRQQKVFRIVSKIARLSPDALSERSLIREELGFDSLMAVEALAAFETVFGIEIDETRAFDLRTVGDILQLLDEYLSDHPKRSSVTLQVL